MMQERFICEFDEIEHINHIYHKFKKGDGYEKMPLAHGIFLIPMIGIFLAPVLSSDQ